jgi:hypothetical protein
MFSSGATHHGRVYIHESQMGERAALLSLVHLLQLIAIERIIITGVKDWRLKLRYDEECQHMVGRDQAASGTQDARTLARLHHVFWSTSPHPNCGSAVCRHFSVAITGHGMILLVLSRRPRGVFLHFDDTPVSNKLALSSAAQLRA